MTQPSAHTEVPPPGRTDPPSPADAGATPGGVVGRLLRYRAAVAGVGERRLLLVAVVLFVAASAVGVANLPPVETEVRWPVLLLLPLVGVPATVAVNAWEYRVTAGLLGHRVPPTDAARVSVLSTAANLLPIPGAVLVRSRALRQRGTGLGAALALTTAIGVSWVGVTAVLAGGLQLGSAGDPVLGGGALVGGLVVLGAAALVAARTRGVTLRRGDIGTVLLVEAVAVLVAAARLLLALWGLGYSASVTQGVALSLAGSLGSAVGFLPAGLGVRELLAAGIGPLVGLPAAVSLVATAVDRVLGLVVLAAITGVLVATGGGTPRLVDEEVA
jgi:uncharacterized membrane protein YbhN (UPF0104 family)